MTSANNKPNEHPCAACKKNLPKAHFSGNQLSKHEKARCKSCVGSGELRRCSICKESLPKSRFSKNQWAKSPSVKKCSGCVAGPLRQSGGDSNAPKKTRAGPKKAPAGALVPVKDTEAFRVRKEQAIGPKERLIKRCELSVLSVLEGNFRGLPSESEVAQGVGYPEVNTPFSYWGLPIAGSMGGSKAIKKRLRRQIFELTMMDDEWFAEHYEDIEPYLEEVASMGRRNGAGLHEEVGWEAHIDEIKATVAMEDEDDDAPFELLMMETEGVQEFDVSIDPLAYENGGRWWRRPPPVDTPAYYLRSRNSIPAQKRLVLYCELLSLSHENGTFEAERTANRQPPRQTSNRYWGIPPGPIRQTFDQDMAAWKFFVDLETTWVESNYEALRLHFAEARARYPGGIRSIESKRLDRIVKLVHELAHMGCLDCPESAMMI